MNKKNIIIAGGGFAGHEAVKVFGKYKNILESEEYRVVLIDPKQYFEFLPMLPDIVGGWIQPEDLRVDLDKIVLKANVIFKNAKIRQIDIKNKTLETDTETISYEYLILSNGMEVNFFNNKDLASSCFKLYSVEDAITIRENLLKRAKTDKKINAVIIGGGYTGVEIATNVRRLLKKNNVLFNVSIVEKAKDILAVLPEKIRIRIKKELSDLEIGILTSEGLKEYDGKTVVLESGKNIEDAFCIWSTGVKALNFIAKLELPHERGRININEFLSVKDKNIKDIYVAGDSGYFMDDRSVGLRMAIMFSLEQGKIAALNIINSILDKKLIEYRPKDLGYLVPMAHGKAFGVVLGSNINSRIGYLMHYFMCVYRSGWRNKFRIIKSFVIKGFKKGG